MELLNFSLQLLKTLASAYPVIIVYIALVPAIQ